MVRINISKVKKGVPGLAKHTGDAMKFKLANHVSLTAPG